MSIYNRDDSGIGGPAEALSSAPRTRTIALEATAAALVFVGLPALFGVMRGPRAGALLPNPGWMAVLLLAARYGNRGFLLAVGAAAGVAAMALAGTHVAPPALLVTLESPANLGALAASMVVAWIASQHHRRSWRLAMRLDVAERWAREAGATVQTLRAAVAALRARVDRTSSSLTFLRDVATRLEGSDPVAAAEAAVELALLRTGARSAALKIYRQGALVMLACRDASDWLPPAPPEELVDILEAPIGGRSGVLVLQGLPRHARHGATAHDLSVIAAWCADALERAGERVDDDCEPKVAAARRIP